MFCAYLTVCRYFPALRQPYQIAVYKVFTRRTVFACQFSIVIVVCFIVATTANWLFHTVTMNFFNSAERGAHSHQAGELNDVILNYGVVIDCGSSGSRVFIYCWPPHNGEPHQLLNIRLLRDSNGNPAVMKTEPGKFFIYLSIIFRQFIKFCFSCQNHGVHRLAYIILGYSCIKITPRPKFMSSISVYVNQLLQSLLHTVLWHNLMYLSE